MLHKNIQIICNMPILKYNKNSHLILRCFSSKQISKGASYLHYIGKKPLVYRTFGQQLEISSVDFSNEAIVSFHEGKRHSFPQLLTEVDRISAGLMKLGLKQGDHVALWGPNTIMWYLSMLAVARAGLVSVGINPAFQGPEIEYCLKKVKCKAVISPESFRSNNYYELLKGICPEITDSKAGNIKSLNLPHLKSIIIDSESKLKGALSFDELRDLGTQDDISQVSKIQHKINPDSPCNIQFTSGTTGKPKAAVISHFNLLNNGYQVGLRNKMGGQRICVQVPLFHAYGICISISCSLTNGDTIVLPAPGFSPKASLDAIVKEKCTIIHGTPTMYVDLVKTQKELQLPLTTAKLAMTGGSSCSPQLFRDIKSTLGVEYVRSVFGLTETTAVIFQSQIGDNMEQVLNTVGHVQDHIEVKVIDNEGKVVPFGEAGELCVRGYCNMLGYFDDEEKTKEVVGQDKWLKTGDKFVLQEDGYGRIIGRLKEMVIRGGENLFPKEIEDFLNTHPDIMEVHVVGVPDKRLGEELCAFVRLRKDVQDMTSESLKKYCKGKIAHFKVPRYCIVVESFPKTVSGKVQKFKLLEKFLQNHSEQ